MTYYPNAPNVDVATRIDVDAATTQRLSPLTLNEERLSSVRGVVSDIGDDSNRRGLVVVSPRDGSLYGMPSFVVPLMPGRSFVVPSLPNGQYHLHTTIGDSTEPPAAATVVVAGRDVPDVRLEPVRPVAIRGRIDTGSVTFGTNTGPIRVVPAHEMSRNALGPQSPGVVGADGTFTATTWPGQGTLTLAGVPSWMLHRIFLRGHDVTDSGIAFPPDADIDGVVIELTSMPTTVRGMVARPVGATVGAIAVVLFATDERKWVGHQGRYVTPALVDENGSFRVMGLPSGRYYAAAVQGAPMEELRDPELLRKLSGRSSPLELAEGSTVDVRIAVVQDVGRRWSSSPW
jgi:hypothetical protein